MPAPLRVTTTLAMLALSATSTACHVSVGNISTPTTSTRSDPTIPKADLEKQTAGQVREQSGASSVVITCPEDLPIKLGAAEQCVLARDGKRFQLTITITEVESPTDVNWDWHVGQQLSW